MNFTEKEHSLFEFLANNVHLLVHLDCFTAYILLLRSLGLPQTGLYPVDVNVIL